MLLGTLAASLLGNLLAEKGIVRAGLVVLRPLLHMKIKKEKEL